LFDEKTEGRKSRDTVPLKFRMFSVHNDFQNKMFR
jgi:hypothetical protein